MKQFCDRGECEKRDLLTRVSDLEEALEQLADLGEQGMKPDYGEWLTFHDKVSAVARAALRS